MNTLAEKRENRRKESLKKEITAFLSAVCSIGEADSIIELEYDKKSIEEKIHFLCEIFNFEGIDEKDDNLKYFKMLEKIMKM